MIYVFEVVYSVNGKCLPPTVKEIKAQTPVYAEKIVKEECPDNFKISTLTLIGSRWA
jgi:hypothetical protein